ncbi:hypothetical protein [Burkholderia pseudomultivorans]|uniref:hypothetical protein n=1 Tax=Burkholderia pseudomultivorans TaxID=1207504 RepID=UPI000AEF65C2|nr:hypothetical protein [Burkholderia pseudomultivorans]
MKRNVLAFIGLLVGSVHAYADAGARSTAGTFDLSVQTKAGEFRCMVDEKPIEATLSSDGEAVIVSGTGYIPVDELSRCKAGATVHVRRAAPHVGFLSDINIKANIYASMVPVSVSPLSFVAVVGKVGSDRNLVQKPGFYRNTVSMSKLQEEASSDMKPTISLDGKFISVDRGQCGSDAEIGIIEIRTGKTRIVDNQTCNRLFNWIK